MNKNAELISMLIQIRKKFSNLKFGLQNWKGFIYSVI